MYILWLVFLSVFVASFACDVWHGDDGVCKIVVPMFCFIVDSPASGNIILYTNQPCSFRSTVTSPAYEVYFST